MYNFSSDHIAHTNEVGTVHTRTRYIYSTQMSLIRPNFYASMNETVNEKQGNSPDNSRGYCWLNLYNAYNTS